MSNSNYVSGRAKEYQTKKALEKLGYGCTRASGSHGPFDIIAYSKSEIRFIQCKKQDKAVGNIEKAYAEDLKKMRLQEVPPGSKKELWIYTNRKDLTIYPVI